MNLVGRVRRPWDALFLFHVFSEEGDQAVGERLQRLITREVSTGLKPLNQVESGNKGSRCRILGRFLEKNDASAVVSAWNAPDGDMAWMCYTPNHGIATVTDGKLDWWALICFQCANAGISGPLSQSNSIVPNRLLSRGSELETELTSLLPERLFPIRQ